MIRSAEGSPWLSIEHFYHVGEDLRHGMTEALIMNAPIQTMYAKPEKPRQFTLEIE